MATQRRLTRDSAFFAQGDLAERFYVLLDGVVRVTRSTSDGDQVVIRHILPGQVFGIARAFDSPRYGATARAAMDSVALGWASDNWDQLAKDIPGFLPAMRSALGTRLDDMQDKIVVMATARVEQRIAHALQNLLRDTGIRTEDGVEIGFPLTRQDISEMTGATLHSVSRCMSQWQKNGVLGGTRRRVVVRRPEDLPI